MLQIIKISRCSTTTGNIVKLYYHLGFISHLFYWIFQLEHQRHKHFTRRSEQSSQLDNQIFSGIFLLFVASQSFAVYVAFLGSTPARSNASSSKTFLPLDWGIVDRASPTDFLYNSGDTLNSKGKVWLLLLFAGQKCSWLSLLSNDRPVDQSYWFSCTHQQFYFVYYFGFSCETGSQTNWPCQVRSRGDRNKKSTEQVANRHTDRSHCCIHDIVDFAFLRKEHFVGIPNLISLYFLGWFHGYVFIINYVVYSRQLKSAHCDCWRCERILSGRSN